MIFWTPMIIEIFEVPSRLVFFYGNNFYINALTIKLIFGSKKLFFSEKCLLGWCGKVTFYITWKPFLSDEPQKKNMVENVFSRTIRFNRFRDINKVVILSKRFDVWLLFRFFRSPWWVMTTEKIRKSKILRIVWLSVS